MALTEPAELKLCSVFSLFVLCLIDLAKVSGMCVWDLIAEGEDALSIHSLLNVIKHRSVEMWIPPNFK